MENKEYICERCGIIYREKFGTGRYCSKKCSYTKTEEIRKNMSKPKSDTSKMGKYDRSGDKNPNAISRHGKLKDRDNNAYENIVNGNNKISRTSVVSEKMKGNSNWMRGKKHSEYTLNLISGIIEGMYESGEIDLKTTRVSKAEIKIKNYLESIGEIFKPQFHIKGETYIYDFCFPEKKLLIEYNGDYWHANPLKYKKDDIIKRTKKTAQEIWNKDKKKKKHAIKNGYRIITIWENDFNKRGLDIIKEALQCV